MYISICIQGLNKIFQFSWSNFSLVIDLNFWANLSLDVLIKFVLVKKSVQLFSINFAVTSVVYYMHALRNISPSKIRTSTRRTCISFLWLKLLTCESFFLYGDSLANPFIFKKAKCSTGIFVWPASTTDSCQVLSNLWLRKMLSFSERENVWF